MYSNLSNLMNKNNELNQQIETLENERITTVTKDYIVKSRDLYFKILELTRNEYELFQLMGSNAPCTAGLLLVKNFPSGDKQF